MEIQNNRIERTTLVLSSVMIIIVFITSGARFFFIQEEENKNQRQETQKLINLNNVVRPFANKENIDFFHQESEKIKNELLFFLVIAVVIASFLIGLAIAIRCQKIKKSSTQPQPQ